MLNSLVLPVTLDIDFTPLRIAHMIFYRHKRFTAGADQQRGIIEDRAGEFIYRVHWVLSHQWVKVTRIDFDGFSLISNDKYSPYWIWEVPPDEVTLSLLRLAL